jgi:hypothetical protein
MPKRNEKWTTEFQARMENFSSRRPHNGGDAVSIKIGIDSGCFHREHSPEAYRLIDQKISKIHDDIQFVEHETGPELLVYLAVGTAALSLGKSVIELITEIIKARSAGIQKGDHPREPLKLIVRRTDEKNGFQEEIILCIGHHESIDQKTIDEKVNAAVLRLFEGEK